MINKTKYELEEGHKVFLKYLEHIILCLAWLYKKIILNTCKYKYKSQLFFR